jgi:hypothetical protein
MGIIFGFCGLQPILKQRVGENNGSERAKMAIFWEVSRTPESARTLGNACRHAGIGKKIPTAYAVGILQWWWRRRESNPRPKVLYRQFYILSAVI